MELRKFLSSTTDLSNCEGPQDHVVLSSRVRLARNVTGRPFPGRAKKASRVETCEF
ncbi:MAG TPA: ATP--guanido phosphotransferase, partial [Verrucomicrobiales bacterium]|nr:ATP--guanido phosphotransferase [Verrucomicrobiales bacterium]